MTSAVIVGAGAIGSWLADALIHAGWSVAMVARGNTLAALTSAGLSVTQGQRERMSHPRCGSPAQLGVHDYVLLTVKAHQLPPLTTELSPLIGEHSSIVSATNGIPWWFFQDFAGALRGRVLSTVDPGGVQARLFGDGRALGAVVHASGCVVSAGRVVITADRLILGEPHPVESARVQHLAEACSAGGIQAVVSKNIRLEVWSKLWGNMCINPVSALTRGTTQRLFADQAVRQLLQDMMLEMQAIGTRLDLGLAMTPPERIDIASRLGDFKTSMLLDLEAHRVLELSPQLGALVEIAEALQIETPKMRAVLALASLLSRQESTR